MINLLFQPSNHQNIHSWIYSFIPHPLALRANSSLAPFLSSSVYCDSRIWDAKLCAQHWSENTNENENRKNESYGQAEHTPNDTNTKRRTHKNAQAYDRVLCTMNKTSHRKMKSTNSKKKQKNLCTCLRRWRLLCKRSQQICLSGVWYLRCLAAFDKTRFYGVSRWMSEWVSEMSEVNEWMSEWVE